MTPDPALAASVLRRLGVRLCCTGVTTVVDVWGRNGEHLARVTLTPAEADAIEAVLDPTGTAPAVTYANGVPAS